MSGSPIRPGDRVSTTYLCENRQGVVQHVYPATHDRGESLVVMLDGDTIPVMRRPYEVVLLRQEVRRAS